MREEITLDLNGDPDKVIRDVMEQYLASLFFIKITDWAGEHEYRFVVHAPDSKCVYVSIQEALYAVIVGSDATAETHALLREQIVELRDQGQLVRLCAMNWWNAYPMCQALSI